MTPSDAVKQLQSRLAMRRRAQSLIRKGEFLERRMTTFEVCNNALMRFFDFYCDYEPGVDDEELMAMVSVDLMPVIDCLTDIFMDMKTAARDEFSKDIYSNEYKGELQIHQRFGCPEHRYSVVAEAFDMTPAIQEDEQQEESK